MLNADEENPWTKKDFGLEDDEDAEVGEEEGDEMMEKRGREQDTAGLVGRGSPRA